MQFFNNPKGKISRRGKRRSKNRRRVNVRRRNAATALRRRVVKLGGSNMARRSKRRRSRRRVAYNANPPKKRRRGRPRGSGRRFGGLSGSVVTTIKQGVKDGAVILVSQVATRKAIGIVGGFVPVPGIAGAAITGLGVPVLISLIGRKVMPASSRLIAAASFAEGVKVILGATPIGGFLSDVVDANYQSMEYSAWPAPQIPANMGAYPGAGLGAYDDEVIDG